MGRIDPNDPEYERKLQQSMKKIWVYCDDCKEKYCLANPCIHHLPDGIKYDIRRKAYNKKVKESLSVDDTSRQKKL